MLRTTRGEHGQTVLEYALIIGVLSLTMIALLVGFGTDFMAATQDRIMDLIS